MNIQKYVPGLQTQKIRLDEYFFIIHPQVTFNIFSIRKFINSQFVLKARREMMPEAWKSQPTLKLRGGNSPLPSLFLLFRMNTIGICLALFSEPTEGKGAGLRNTCDCPTAGSGRVRLLTLNASNPIDQGSDPPVPLLSRSLEFLKFL